MGKIYIFSSRWEKNIVAILHFYGDRAIFLLFWDNQDTEPDLYEIEISISKPIPTHKIHQRLYGIYIYTRQDR